LLKYYIEKQRSVVAEMLLKFATFNLLAVFGFFIFKLLFGISPVNLTSFSIWVLLGLILVGQAIFLLYDYVLSRLINYYINRIKAGVHRK
jgi:hypothetical protein